MKESGAKQPGVPLPEDGDLAPEIVATLKKLPPLNVFRALTNTPASFQPFVELALSILGRSEFDRLKREVAVLRVAHLTKSHYEWTQHVRIARSLGMEAATIAKIGADGPVTGLDDEGNLLCRVADEITRDVRLSDATLEAILARYGTRQASELILCCAYFNMLSRILESLRVELEPEPPI